MDNYKATMNRSSTLTPPNTAPRPPLHHNHRRPRATTTSTTGNGIPSPVQEEAVNSERDERPTRRSDAKSYLKSRRANARNERRSNIMNMLDRNIDEAAPASCSSPQEESHLSKIDTHHTNDSSITNFCADSQSTLGKYQPPTSQTSTATTATNTSRGTSPPVSPVIRKGTVHRRTLHIMNMFRRAGDSNNGSNHSRTALSSRPARSVSPSKKRSTSNTKGKRQQQSTKKAEPKLRETLEHKQTETVEEDESITESVCLDDKERKKKTKKTTKKSDCSSKSSSKSKKGKVRSVVAAFEHDQKQEVTQRTRNTGDNVKESQLFTIRRSSQVSQVSSVGGGSHADSSKCLPAPSPPRPRSPSKRKGCSSHHQRSIDRPTQAPKVVLEPINAPVPLTVHNVLLADTSGNAGKYTGTISGNTGKPHGYGKMSYQTADKASNYEGDWNQGQWNGKGRYVKHNGDSYEGELCDDQKHGNGVYHYADAKRRFEGRYVMGHRVEGTMLYSDRSVYKGQWYNGKRQGKGIYRFSDKSIYKGDFDSDRIHGAGQLLWPNGSRYVGQWSRGQRHGKGKEYDRHGNIRYTGVWKHNTMVKERSE